VLTGEKMARKVDKRDIDLSEVGPTTTNRYWTRVVVSADEAKEYPGGKGWSYIDTDVCGALTVNAGLFEMAPGTGSADKELHSHSQEEFNYIVQGQGFIAVEDELHHFQTGDFVFVPAFARHGWKNTGDEPLRVLFYRPIKAEPPKQENTAFDLRRFKVEAKGE
jgi:quercetin dioxygenase-like cupin family protein